MISATPNRLVNRWQSGQGAIGVTLPFPSPELAELCGLMGFDFVLIDGEHGTISGAECGSLVRACQVAGATPLVRVSHNHPVEILHALDVGAAGVMVPGIESAEAARRAARSAHYAPQGDRGLAATRASGWGLSTPLTEHVRQANESVVVVLLVESLQGMQHLAEMAAVDGVDAIFLGPADLSQSMGYPGDVNHPEVVQVLETALATIVAGGKIAGIAAPSGAKARHWQEQHRVRMIATGLPQLLIAGGREFLADGRR